MIKYSGALYAEYSPVSNVFDCVKRCYVDPNCKAYESRGSVCKLFSEVVEPALNNVPKYERTLGIKPNRLSSNDSMHLTFKFILVKNTTKSERPKTPIKVMKRLSCTKSFQSMTKIFNVANM